MGSRSRKRRRPASAPVAAAGTARRAEPAPEPESASEPAPEPAPEPEAKPAPEPEAAAAPTPTDAMRRGYARSRERDELIREGLEPLAPGERPGAVTIAAIVALGFAIANVAAALAGADLSSEQDDPATISAVTTAILVVAAIGMWLRQYWAVLGFQIVLALQIVVLSLALVRVEKWWLGIGMVIVIGLLTWLFWKLVRAMARLQMPARSERRHGEPTR